MSGGGLARIVPRGYLVGATGAGQMGQAERPRIAALCRIIEKVQLDRSRLRQKPSQNLAGAMVAQVLRFNWFVVFG